MRPRFAATLLKQLQKTSKSWRSLSRKHARLASARADATMKRLRESQGQDDAAAAPAPMRPARRAAPPRKGVAARGTVVDGNVACDAGNRNYRLYVPAGQSARPLPLLVMLHGCSQDPDDMARGSRMDALADEMQFMVVYPEQTRRHHSAGCWNWFRRGDQQRDRGEPAILAAITQHVVANHSVDPRRVYVAGLSAGGAMAAILAHHYPDLFAALGVHAGVDVGAARNATSALAAMRTGLGLLRMAAPFSQSMPLMVVHGDTDRTVHPRNAAFIMARFTGGAQVSSVRRLAPAGRLPYTRTLYRDLAGNKRAEQWMVHGMGHAWSGGSPRGSHTDSRGPDASREMMRFFLGLPRSRAAPRRD